MEHVESYLYQLFYYKGQVNSENLRMQGKGKICTKKGFVYEGEWNDNFLEVEVDPQEVDLPGFKECEYPLQGVMI